MSLANDLMPVYEFVMNDAEHGKGILLIAATDPDTARGIATEHLQKNFPSYVRDSESVELWNFIGKNALLYSNVKRSKVVHHTMFG